MTARYIEALVEVHLSEVIELDLEGFLDLISERSGCPVLMDINYSIVGCNLKDNIITLKVTGDASECDKIEEDNNENQSRTE